LASNPPEKKIWTILDLLNWGTVYLSEKGFDETRLTIELLLAHTLKLQRIQLYMNYDRPLNEIELSSFKGLLKRRLTNEPLQYILGETEFMGLKFLVDNRVLIPRADTELLVEKSEELIKIRFSIEEEIRILDIGTGSGCIAVSLAKMISNAKIVAIDSSVDALEIAKINAEKNTVTDRIEFLLLDMMNIDQSSFSSTFHCIVSNPPYISSSEFANVAVDVREYEPNDALIGGDDGLKYYPQIASIAKQYLTHNGFVGVEHQFDQSELVQKIFNEKDFKIITTIKDYSGHFRHVFAER
jgi:release factor glutamine methyltransferase